MSHQGFAREIEACALQGFGTGEGTSRRVTMHEASAILDLPPVLLARRVEAGDIASEAREGEWSFLLVDVLAFKPTLDAQQAAMRELATDGERMEMTYGLAGQSLEHADDDDDPEELNEGD